MSQSSEFREAEPAGVPGQSSPTPGKARGQAVGTVGGQRLIGKTRNPWGVWLLALVTFGLYGLWWYYTVNQELREFDESIEVEPVLSVLALFVPICNLVSMFRSGERIALAQRLAGAQFNCSGLVGLLLALVGFAMPYYQTQLNKVWDVYGNPPPRSPVTR